MINQIRNTLGATGGLYDTRRDAVTHVADQQVAPQPPSVQDQMLLNLATTALSLASSGLGAVLLASLATNLRQARFIPPRPAIGPPRPGSGPVGGPVPRGPGVAPGPELEWGEPGPELSYTNPIPSLSGTRAGGQARLDPRRIPALPAPRAPLQGRTEVSEGAPVATSAATHMNNAVNNVGPGATTQLLDAVRRDHRGALTPTLLFKELELQLLRQAAQAHLDAFEETTGWFRTAPDGWQQAQAMLAAVRAQRDAAYVQQYRASVVNLLNLLSSGHVSSPRLWERSAHTPTAGAALDVRAAGVLGLEVEVPSLGAGLIIRRAHLEGVTQEVRDDLARQTALIKDFPVVLRIMGDVVIRSPGTFGTLAVRERLDLERLADGTVHRPPRGTGGFTFLWQRQRQRRGDPIPGRPDIECDIDATIEARRIIETEVGGRTLASLGTIPEA